MEEGNKRKKKKDYFGVVDGEKKRWWQNNVHMCRPKHSSTGWQNKKNDKGNETNYFNLITYGGGWLKFPCRYSLSGSLEITPDVLQIRAGSELHLKRWLMAAYHSKQATAVKHIDRAVVNVSLSVTPFFFSSSLCLTMQMSLHAVRVYWYFCLCLSDCEQPNDWNSFSFFLRDNSQGKGETWQKRECKSVYPFFFSSKLKCERFFFTLSGWVVSEWHTVKTELCTNICLPRLSVYILTPKIDIGWKEAKREHETKKKLTTGKYKWQKVDW